MILERLAGVEALHEHAGGAGGSHHAEPAVEPEHVKERKDEKDDVVRRHHGRLDRADVAQVGKQRAVGEHGALRRPGRSRGVEQDREVFAGAGRRHWPRRRSGEQVGEGQHPLGRRASDGDDRLQRRARPASFEQRPQVRGGDHGKACAAVAEQVSHLAGGVGRVDRYDDEAGTQRAEVADSELDDIAEHDRHPITGRRAPPRATPRPSGRRPHRTRPRRCSRESR